MKTSSLARSVPIFHDTSMPREEDVSSRSDTIKFFAERARSLKRLHISNVQFGYSRPRAGEEDHGLALVRPLLEIFQSAPVRSDFTWTVVRQPHTEECEQQTFSSCLRTRPMPVPLMSWCGLYGPNIWVWDWDALAKELGLVIDPESQTWDLAKAVLSET